MVLRDEVQLSAALEAFSLAHRLRMRWTRRFSMHLEAADITSIDSLASHCSGGSINDELELYDAPKEDLLDEATIESLQAFLPGPVGFQCFRLAQRVAEKVEKRSADTKYAHRSRNGEEENEMWHVPLTGKWIVNVDCGGLIRVSTGECWIVWQDPTVTAPLPFLLFFHPEIHRACYQANFHYVAKRS